MNQVQMEYLVAKAGWMAAEELYKEVEIEFLRSKGYNESRIYCIRDKVEFEKLNIEFAEYPKAVDAYFLVKEAESKKAKAEENLIDWGLSCIPSQLNDVKETLIKLKNNWKAREELIKIAIQVEV